MTGKEKLLSKRILATLLTGTVLAVIMMLVIIILLLMAGQ